MMKDNCRLVPGLTWTVGSTGEEVVLTHWQINHCSSRPNLVTCYFLSKNHIGKVVNTDISYINFPNMKMAGMYMVDGLGWEKDNEPYNYYGEPND